MVHHLSDMPQAPPQGTQLTLEIVVTVKEHPLKLALMPALCIFQPLRPTTQ